MLVSAQLRWIHWAKNREFRIGSLTISGDPDIMTAAMRMIQTCNTWMLTTAVVHQDMNQIVRINLREFCNIHLSLSDVLASECPKLENLSHQ